MTQPNKKYNVSMFETKDSSEYDVSMFDDVKKKDGTETFGDGYSDIQYPLTSQGDISEPISEPFSHRDVELNPFFAKGDNLEAASKRASRKLRKQLKHIPLKENYVFVTDLNDIPESLIEESKSYVSPDIFKKSDDFVPIDKDETKKDGSWKSMQAFAKLQTPHGEAVVSEPVKTIDENAYYTTSTKAKEAPIIQSTDENGQILGYWHKETTPDLVNKVRGIDYVGSKAATSSILAKGFLYANAALLSTMDDDKGTREIAQGFMTEIHKDMSNYTDPSLFTDLTATVLGFVSDAYIFKGGGFIGGVASKGIGTAGSVVEKKLIEAGIKKSVATQAVKTQLANQAAAHTAGALGAHRFLGDLTDQYGDASVEEISYSQALKAGAWGLVSGVGVGYVGALTNSLAQGVGSNYITKNIKNGTLNSRTVANAKTLSSYTKAAGFTGEVGVFELANVLENGPDSFSKRGLLENAMFLSLLKGNSSKKLKEYINPEKALPELKIPYTDAELMEMGQGSVQNLTEKMTSNRLEYADILNNKDISLHTKMKLMFNTDGVTLSNIPRPASVEIDTDGLRLYSKDGQYLSSISKDDALGSFGELAINSQKVVDMYNSLDRLANLSTPEELVEVDKQLRKMGYEEGVEAPIFKDVIINNNKLTTDHHKAIDNFTDVIKKSVELKESELQEGDILERQQAGGVKGFVKKSKDGVIINDDLLGKTELKTTSEVDALRDVTKKELDEVDTETQRRLSIPEETEYYIGDKVFETRDAFIKGLEDLMKNESIDALALMDDSFIKGKDVSASEIFKVAQDASDKIQGMDATDRIKTEFKSSKELTAVQRMLEARLDRADIAEEIITGKDTKASEATQELRKGEEYKAVLPSMEAPVAQQETTIPPKTGKSATKGVETLKTPSTEETPPIKKIRKQASIMDAESGAVYYVKESGDNINIEVSKEITNKATELKRSQLERLANEELAKKRQEIIDDIRGIDSKLRDEGFVQHKGNNYKILTAPSGEKTVMSYTERTKNQRPSKVTNEKIKDAVLKEFDKQSEKLSDVEMETYETSVEEAKNEIMDKVEKDLKEYQDERAKMLEEEGIPTFKESDEIKSKSTDKASGIKGRKDLPSEKDKADNKKLIDTWQQFRKELSIAEKASKKGAASKKKEIKDRAVKLMEMVDANKDMLDVMPSSVVNAIRNRVVQGGFSEAKYNQAVKYIEDVFTKAEFRKDEIDKAAEVAKITKRTSDKGLYLKGGKKKAKQSLLSRSADTSGMERLSFIGKLVNPVKGKTKSETAKLTLEREKYRKSARKELEKNEAKMDALVDIGFNKTESISLKEIDRYFEIQELNEILEFANIDNMNLEQTKVLRERVEKWFNNQKTRAEIERVERKARILRNSNEVIDAVTGGVGVYPSEEVYKKAQRLKKNKQIFQSLSFSDASFFSLLNKLAKNDLKDTREEGFIFNDRLNEMFATDVRGADRTMESLRNDFAIDQLSKSHEIFKTKSDRELDRRFIKLETPKESGIRLFNKNGSVNKTLEISEMQAAAKWLQWRDPTGRENMSVPKNVKLREGEYGMGYTEETIKDVEKFLSPEMKKYAEYVYDEINNRWSQKYDEAYKKEYGVSMLADQDGYFPLYKKNKASSNEIEDMAKRSGIQTNRTMKRTGEKGELLYNSLQDMMIDYVNEASRFIAWAEPLRELQYVFKNNNVRNALRQEYGNNGTKYTDHFIDVFSGKNDRVTFDLVDQAMRNMGVGILGFKAMPMIKQTLSSGYYMLNISPSRVPAFGANMTRMLTMSDPTARALNEYILQDPMVKARHSHALDIAAGQSKTRSTIRKIGDPTWVNKVKAYIPVKELEKLASAPLRFGDRMPIVKAGGAYVMDKYKVYSGKSLTEDVIKRASNGDVDVAFKRAMTDWDLISTLTQQSMSESNISYVRRMSSWGRALNAFTSGPAQIHRVSMANLRDMNKAIQKRDAFGLERSTRKFLISHAISGLMFELASQHFHIPDNKDDADAFKAAVVFGNSFGFAYVGRGFQLVKDLYNNEYWADEGISISPVLENLDVVITNGSKITKELFESENPDWDEIGVYGKKLSVSLSSLMGVPLDGTIKIYKGNKQNFLNRDDMSTYDKALRSVGVGTNNYRAESPIYTWRNKNLDFKKAISEIDGTMNIVNNKINIDQHAADLWIEQISAIGLDASSIVAIAISRELSKQTSKKINKAGYNAWRDTRDADKIDEILKNVDLNQKEVQDLFETSMKLLNRNPELVEMKARNKMNDMLMKAMIEGGYDISYTDK